MDSKAFKLELTKDIKKRQMLFERYAKYMYKYKVYYARHLSEEYNALKKHFPNVKFSMRARIKSYDSYIEKVERKIREGKTGNVYDIFAKKYIITDVNGIQDEEQLINMCYEFQQFILDFNKTKFVELSDKRKDYILSPKPNNYQALHITTCSKKANDLFSETQIKTFRMQECSDTGEASHREYKDRTSIDRKRVPIYFTSTSILDKTNHYIVYELSPEECISYFYKPPKPAIMQKVQEGR